MQAHTLTSPNKRARKRVGRGFTRGTTAGRGTKGQKARSGYSSRAGFEGGRAALKEQLPKVRGSALKAPTRFNATVTLRMLEKAFSKGEEVTIDRMKEAGVIPMKTKRVKVVVKGELHTSLIVHAHGVSESAQAAIEQVGGSVVLVKPEERLTQVQKGRKAGKPISNVKKTTDVSDKTGDASKNTSQ